MLGQAPIAESLVSSIRATVTSTVSSVLHRDFSTFSVTPPSTSQITSSTAPDSAPQTPASTYQPASAAGMDQPAKIGKGMGVSFGTLLLAILSFIAFRLYRKPQKELPNCEKSKEPASELKDLETRNVNSGLQQTHELTGEEAPKEVYTLHNTHEFEA